MFPALPLADFVLKSPDQLREAYQSACAHIIILDFAAPRGLFASCSRRKVVKQIVFK